MTMTLLGGAIARSWGEAAWTARDMLKVRVPAGLRELIATNTAEPKPLTREEVEAAVDFFGALPDGATAHEQELRDRAGREPLGVDISDYSDEWCAGFLAGQANALDAVAREGEGR